MLPCSSYISPVVPYAPHAPMDSESLRLKLRYLAKIEEWIQLIAYVTGTSFIASW